MLLKKVTTIEICKPYERRIIPTAILGNVVESRYRVRRDENENAIYTKVEEYDIREYIESFKVGASLQSMLERCNLLPVSEKIRMLQQQDDGFSADLSNLPCDGTEAFIMLRDLKAKYPDVVSRIAAGETFDAVIKSIFSPDTKSNESEVIENGKNESGNE